MHPRRLKWLRWKVRRKLWLKDHPNWLALWAIHRWVLFGGVLLFLFGVWWGKRYR